MIHWVLGRAVGEHSDRETQLSEKASFKEVAFKQRQEFRMNQPLKSQGRILPVGGKHN